MTAGERTKKGNRLMSDSNTIEYLVHPLLKRNLVNTVVGASGASKTTFLLQMFEAMATEASFLGCASRLLPKTLYISLDRAKVETEDKLRHFNIPPDRFKTISLAHRLKEISSLSKVFDMVPLDVEMVVVDGVGLIVAKIISQREVGIVCSEALSFCMQRKATVILVHHTAKVKGGQQYGNLRERAAGSGAWVQMSAVSILMEAVHPEEVDDPDRDVYVMQNNLPGCAFHLSVDGGRLIEREVEADGVVEDWVVPLVELLRTGPQPRAALIELGYSDKRLRKAVERELVERDSSNYGYYRLPGGKV